MDPSSGTQDVPSSATEVFQNPLLLPLIFEHLPRPSAMRLRLVNKTWNKAALPVIRKRAPYINVPARITTSERNLNYYHKFLHYLRSSPNTPFTKLSVELTPQLNGSLWNALLQSAAPILTHLHVKGVGKQKHLTLDPSLPPDIRLPKLEHLKIFLDPNADAAQDPPRFLAGIIAASPNLKSLRVSSLGRRVLHQLTHQGHPVLQLEKLMLGFNYVDHAFYEAVANFLITQRDSLLQLRINANHVRKFVGNGVSFSLPKVKALRLRDYKEHHVEHGPDRVEYANKFPNLEKVHLESWSKKRYRDFFAENTGVPSTSVTSLELGHLTSVECQDAMVKYGPSIFPNLVSLSVSAGFRNLLKLVGKLEHLETLTLKWSPEMGETVDSIFCGLDDKDWHKQGRISLQPFGLVKDFRRMMDHHPYSAWHKIRILHFSFDGNCRFPVSESVCRLVLLQMRNLKEVHFMDRKPKENEISASVMKQMEAKFEIFFPWQI